MTIVPIDKTKQPGTDANHEVEQPPVLTTYAHDEGHLAYSSILSAVTVIVDYQQGINDQPARQ